MFKKITSLFCLSLLLISPITPLFQGSADNTPVQKDKCISVAQRVSGAPVPDARGAYLMHLDSKEELYDLLENGIDWKSKPWGQSHLGAGVYAALVNSDEITPEFSENYFAWFRDNADPVTGFWKKDVADKAPLNGHAMCIGDQAVLFQYMAGGFHYLFNHEYAKQPLMYPEKVIDSCIDLYNKGLPDTFGMYCDFLEIDWVFCMTRALRQTTHRHDEAMAQLWDFAKKYVKNLTKDDYFSENNRFNDRFNDLHCLFGASCCLAELQQTFRGQIVSDKPLKLVLDRRPFI